MGTSSYQTNDSKQRIKYLQCFEEEQSTKQSLQKEYFGEKNGYKRSLLQLDINISNAIAHIAKHEVNNIEKDIKGLTRTATRIFSSAMINKISRYSDF